MTAQELSVLVDWVFLFGSAGAVLYFVVSVVLTELRYRRHEKQSVAELDEFHRLLREGKRDEAQVFALRVLQRISKP